MSDPVTFILIFAAAIVVVAGFAWWLRGYWAKEKMAGLEQRLQLARDQYAAVNSQLTDVKAQVADQEKVIAELKWAPPAPVARVQKLERSNTEIQSALTNLSTSTSSLGTTLTITGGQYRLLVEPMPEMVSSVSS